MAKENVGLDFRLKKVDETRKYLLDDIKYNDLMSKKHKKLCRALNNLQNFLVFVSLFGVPVMYSAVMSSAVGIKNFAITAGIKIVKKNQLSRKRGKIMIK